MKHINTVLILVGLGLVAAIIAVGRGREQPLSASTGEGDVVLRRTIHHQRQPAPPTTLPEIVLPEGFSWDSIESRDYKQYIANLRAIECPERTIRDIIVADINKLYEPREAPLRVDKLYTADRAPEKWGDLADLQRMRQLRDVQLEKRALLKELLGIVIPLDPMRTVNPRPYGNFQAAFNALPEEKRADVQMIQENYWYYSDYLNTQFPNRRDPKYVEEYRRINEERRRELIKTLTPAELEDYELRTSHTADYMREQLGAFAATEQEFRDIFRVKADYDTAVGGKYVGHLGPVEEAFPETKSEIQQRVRQLLGEDRYRDYERAQDPNYRALTQITVRYDLPPGAASSAYGIDQEYRDATKRLAALPELTAEQRKMELLNARAQADQALMQLLGERGSRAFQRMRR